MLSRNNFINLGDAQNKLYALYEHLPPFEQVWEHNTDNIISELINKLGETEPFFHPNYIGHMSSYVSDIAIMSYFLTMQINPNNHSYDGGKATTEMEIECIREIAKMFGWKNHHGHLTSGGTSGNLEALWFHRENGADTIIVSKDAHYTHKRMAGLLGMRCIELKSEIDGRVSIEHLRQILRNWSSAPPVIVCTLGTTLTGTLEPLMDINYLGKKHGSYIQVDAAYGGYYTLIKNKMNLRSKLIFDAIIDADSVVIDPHKHGLQGFGCGAVLFNLNNEIEIGNKYHHDSPYTYFKKNGVNLGETSLECSRPGAAAAALWATMKAMPLVENSEFSKMLISCHFTAIRMAKKLCDHGIFKVINPVPDLDIVVFHIKCKNIDLSTIMLYEKLIIDGFYVSIARCDIEDAGVLMRSIKCIRMTIMKKEHSLICDSLFDKIAYHSEKIINEINSNDIRS